MLETCFHRQDMSESAPKQSLCSYSYQGFNVYIIFYLSFLTVFSSIPYSLLTYTLQNWQFDQHLSITHVALFTLTQVPYFLNPLWGYVIDRFYSVFSERFYFLLSIFMVMVSCLGLSMSLPGESGFWMWALVMCFGASWFDAALGCYRTHFTHGNLASMAASVNLSYRVGMILFQAGLVMVAHFVSWQAIYIFLSLLCWVWVVGVLWGHKVVGALQSIQKPMIPVLKAWLKDEVGFWGMGYLFVFHASYFWMATILLGYFRMVLGIEAIEVAAAMKFYGVGLTLLMSFTAGYWIKKYRFKYMAYLLLLQLALWSVMLIIMYHHLPAHMMMVLLISIENISHGFFATMAVALILHCSNKDYPATTMAILTSTCLVSRLVIASFSGWVFEYSMHGFALIFMALAILPIICVYRSPLMRRLHLEG